jgi:hypothetical protein
MITPPPTDAMGNGSLLFVLGFLGRKKIGSASAMSGFPLEIFLRGQTKQRRQPLTVLVGRMVGSPVGGYVGGLLVVPLGLCPGCCLGVADSAIGPSQAGPVPDLRGVALLVGVPAIARPRLGSQLAFVTCRGVVEHRKRGKSNGVLLEVSDSGQDRARPGDCGSCCPVVVGPAAPPPAC